MDNYELPVAQPKLTRVERLVYNIICNLFEAQIDHRFDDLDAPPPPGFWRFLCGPRSALREWDAATDEYYRRHGFPEPRSPLPLAQLWPTINPPRGLVPYAIEDDDLYFDSFLISQRQAEHDRLWYIVGAPTSDVAFRCLVEASTGRHFCTATEETRCSPPAVDDVTLLRIRTKAFDCSNPSQCAPTVPTEIDVYVPGCYGPWRIMNSKRSPLNESIIGSEQSDEPE